MWSCWPYRFCICGFQATFFNGRVQNIKLALWFLDRVEQSWLRISCAAMRASRIRHLGISPAERVVTRKKLGGKWDLRAILVAQTSLPPFLHSNTHHTAHLIERSQLELDSLIFLVILRFYPLPFIDFHKNSVRKYPLWCFHITIVWEKSEIQFYYSPSFNHALFKYLQSQDLLHWFHPYLILADNFRNFPTYSTQTFFEQILVEANSFSRKYPWNSILLPKSLKFVPIKDGSEEFLKNWQNNLIWWIDAILFLQKNLIWWIDAILFLSWRLNLYLVPNSPFSPLQLIWLFITMHSIYILFWWIMCVNGAAE